MGTRLGVAVDYKQLRGTEDNEISRAGAYSWRTYSLASVFRST